jgi:hypothetical protein
MRWDDLNIPSGLSYKQSKRIVKSNIDLNKGQTLHKDSFGTHIRRKVADVWYTTFWIICCSICMLVVLAVLYGMAQWAYSLLFA